MTKTSSLHDPADKLEQVLLRQNKAEKRFRIAVLAGLLLFCGLVGWQMRLVDAHLERLQSNDKEHLFWLLCHANATAEERTTAFLKLVAAGNNEWRSARLAKLDLKGIDLDGIDLQQAGFEAADLSNASLNGALLENVDFRLVDLTKANLSNARMIEADLLRAVLTEANLRSAELQGASLEQVTAHKAEMVLVNLSDGHLLMADLTGADLTGANLSGANLEAAILVDTNLALTDLAGAVLIDTDLTDSNWWRARGLSSDQIADFTKRFPPTQNAGESRMNDFRLWLQPKPEGK